MAEDASGPAPVAELGAGLGPQLGDYRIVRQIGRGGMGVVYEAEQQSLKRRVALKALPLAAAIEPKQLRRFHVEAQAAAQLHHTNIVPVYAVGCERGVHYYAMQYIEGKTLAELIRELRQLEGREAAEPAPEMTQDGDVSLASMLATGQLAPLARPAMSDPRAGSGEDAPATRVERPASPKSHPSSSSRTSAYFRTVANLGIQAAEALDHAHEEGVIHRDIKPANLMVDVRGHLWITDFGLARLQNDSGLTLSGDLLGTIRYMSPEQAIGQRAVVDQRTDIYSLGVTLYELLALEPAFGGGDRREVLRKIVEEEPRPLRSLNSSVPRELETIIEKASVNEPGSRYRTAHELAEDLRRFLEHKTIKARRPTPLERFAKWSRRHIAFVISAASVLSLAVIGLAISTTMIAAKQREVARQRDRARQAIDDLFADVSGQLLTQQKPDLEKVRRDFLEKALIYYQELAADRDGTANSLYQAATAYRRVQGIYTHLGRHLEAVEALRRETDLLQEVASRVPGHSVYRLALAKNSNDLGVLLSDMGKLDDSVLAFHKGLGVLEALSADFPTEVLYEFRIACVKANLCMPLSKLGRVREVEALYRESRTVFAGLNSGFPDDPSYQGRVASVDTSLGALLSSEGRLAEAEQILQKAVCVTAELTERFPDSPEHRERLRNALVVLSDVLVHSGRTREAEESLRRALVVAERIAEATTSSWPKTDLARIYGRLGHLQMADGKPQEAEAALRHRLDLVKQWGAAMPAFPDHPAELAGCYNDLGRVLLEKGRAGEARDAFRDARTHWERQVAATPEVQTYRRELARFLADCPDPTCRDATRALELAQAVVAAAPEDPAAWATLGIARFRGGEPEGVVEPLRNAIEMTSGGDVRNWFFLAMALTHVGDRDQARCWYVKAADWTVTKRPKDQELLGLRAKAAAVLGLKVAPVVARSTK